MAYLASHQLGARSKLDVLVSGSLARGEVTENSDFDFFIVAHGLPEQPDETRQLLLLVEKLRDQLRYEPAGRTGMFGRVVAAADLTERIGLEQDTNATHSLRILILLESRSIYQRNLHEQLVDAILDRYLLDYLKKAKNGVPRFLFNDVVRYWRTVAVDYQAKRWGEWGRGEKWGLRYLKLLVSRKLAFAGTITSLLLPAAKDEEANVDFFRKQFAMPPLARLAQIYNSLDEPQLDSLREVLAIADEFLELLADKQRRGVVEAVTEPRLETETSEFGRWRKRGNDLQVALENIFFDSSLLGRLSRRYLSF